MKVPIASNWQSLIHIFIQELVMYKNKSLVLHYNLYNARKARSNYTNY